MIQICISQVNLIHLCIIKVWINRLRTIELPNLERVLDYRKENFPKKSGQAKQIFRAGNKDLMSLALWSVGKSPNFLALVSTTCVAKANIEIIKKPISLIGF